MPGAAQPKTKVRKILDTSRSDNGPEFVAKAVQEWIAVGAKTAYIEPGKQGRP